MPVVIKFAFRYMGLPKITKRDFGHMVRDVYADLGRFWHTQFRRKHFTRAGAREYNYHARSGEAGREHPQGFRRSYTGKKLRYKGHTLPLVYSGEARQLSRLHRIVANSKGVRVVMPALRKLNWRNKQSPIRMAAEMRTVSLKEMNTLQRIGATALERRVIGYRRRVVVNAA